MKNLKLSDQELKRIIDIYHKHLIKLGFKHEPNHTENGVLIHGFWRFNKWNYVCLHSLPEDSDETYVWINYGYHKNHNGMHSEEYYPGKLEKFNDWKEIFELYL